MIYLVDGSCPAGSDAGRENYLSRPGMQLRRGTGAIDQVIIGQLGRVDRAHDRLGTVRDIVLRLCEAPT